MESLASKYESSGSQFYRTTAGIQSGLDTFHESRFVMTFLTIFRIMEILRSFGLVLEEKAGKGIPGSSRLQLPDKLLANNFALADADNNNYKPLNRGGIVDLPLLRTLLAIPKSPKRATILKSDRIFCFCSIYKFGSFKNPSVMTTSLPELYFRSRRFILLVQKKKKKKLSEL